MPNKILVGPTRHLVFHVVQRGGDASVYAEITTRRVNGRAVTHDAVLRVAHGHHNTPISMSAHDLLVLARRLEAFALRTLGQPEPFPREAVSLTLVDGRTVTLPGEFSQRLSRPLGTLEVQTSAGEWVPMHHIVAWECLA